MAVGWVDGTAAVGCVAAGAVVGAAAAGGGGAIGRVEKLGDHLHEAESDNQESTGR